MENTNLNKKKVTITLDVDILEELKAMDTKVSTLINNLLVSHLSLYSSQTSKRLITRRSVVQIHSSLFKGLGIGDWRQAHFLKDQILIHILNI
jgi:hypothetical protein